jgi:phytoene synthase
MPSLADMVRRRDPDRFFCALFAPAPLREALFTLYAFNAELARAQDVASEPALALIRLQWWRDTVEGADRRHEVASPLRGLLAAGALEAAPLLDMIAAREADIEGPPASLADFVARMRDGPGGLAAASGALAGADDAELRRLRHLGAAYGIAGTLRNVPALATRQRCVLPLDVLAAAGLVPEAAFTDPKRVTAAVSPALNAACMGLLGRRKHIRRILLPAALPAVLARRDLGRAEPAVARGVGDRLAVIWAAARCVV